MTCITTSLDGGAVPLTHHAGTDEFFIFSFATLTVISPVSPGRLGRTTTSSVSYGQIIDDQFELTRPSRLLSSPSERARAYRSWAFPPVAFEIENAVFLFYDEFGFLSIRIRANVHRRPAGVAHSSPRL